MGGKWRYSNASANPGVLHLQDGQFINKRLEVNQAREALGIQIRPDGKMKDEVKYLRAKAVQWADALRTKKLKPSEAWYCLNATIMKTIEYPLMATTMSRKDIDTIMRPVLQAALRKCKIQSRLPWKLVYGTLRARGIGL